MDNISWRMETERTFLYELKQEKKCAQINNASGFQLYEKLFVFIRVCHGFNSNNTNILKCKTTARTKISRSVYLLNAICRFYVVFFSLDSNFSAYKLRHIHLILDSWMLTKIYWASLTHYLESHPPQNTELFNKIFSFLNHSHALAHLYHDFFSKASAKFGSHPVLATHIFVSRLN